MARHCTTDGSENAHTRPNSNALTPLADRTLFVSQFCTGNGNGVSTIPHTCKPLADEIYRLICVPGNRDYTSIGARDAVEDVLTWLYLLYVDVFTRNVENSATRPVGVVLELLITARISPMPPICIRRECSQNRWCRMRCCDLSTEM